MKITKNQLVGMGFTKTPGYGKDFYFYYFKKIFTLELKKTDGTWYLNGRVIETVKELVDKLMYFSYQYGDRDRREKFAAVLSGDI